MVAIRNVDIKATPDPPQRQRLLATAEGQTLSAADRVTLQRYGEPPVTTPAQAAQPQAPPLPKEPPASTPPPLPNVRPDPKQPLLDELPPPRPLAELLSEETASKVPIGGEMAEGPVRIVKRQVTDAGVTWVETVQTITTRQREVPADDGGPAWCETESGEERNRTRLVPATDGGKPWTEQETIRGNRVDKCRAREVPATDGGPAWTKYEGDTSYRYRYVKPQANDLGQDWLEVDDNGTLVHQRTIRSHDERGEWFQKRIGDNFHMLNRTYTDDKGDKWEENRQGDNHWRVRCGGYSGLQAEAAARGEASMLAVGDAKILVFGAATADELRMLSDVLQAAPPQSYSKLQAIYLSENLGETLNRSGERIAKISGFTGDKGDLVIDRSSLQRRATAQFVLYHELGHLQDKATAPRLLSNAKPWGVGHSVSLYGQTNAMEDLAETHRDVLTRRQAYVDMSRFGWLFESAAAKKREILKMYGIEVPRYGALDKLVQAALRKS